MGLTPGVDLLLEIGERRFGCCSLMRSNCNWISKSQIPIAKAPYDAISLPMDPPFKTPPPRHPPPNVPPFPSSPPNEYIPLIAPNNVLSICFSFIPLNVNASSHALPVTNYHRSQHSQPRDRLLWLPPLAKHQTRPRLLRPRHQTSPSSTTSITTATAEERQWPIIPSKSSKTPRATHTYGYYQRPNHGSQNLGQHPGLAPSTG